MKKASTHSKPQLHVQLRIMAGNDIALGPGKADLLEGIAATGSISAAARRMGMSYRRGWQLVDTMNRCFKRPLVETNTGGVRGGGARLTELGGDVLRRYRKMEARVHRTVARESAAFRCLLIKAGKAEKTLKRLTSRT